MDTIRRLTSKRTLDAAKQYFTDEELSHADARRDTLTIFDAVFRRRGDGLIVETVPDDPWLREHVASLPDEQAVWEVAAFVKVRRISTPQEIVERARSGELYDESYFTKRGGGAPYVGYPLELNGAQGNFERLSGEIQARFAPRRLLDVGCATGHLVKGLRDRGVEA